MEKIEIGVTLSDQKFRVGTKFGVVEFQFDREEAKERLRQLDLSVADVAKHAHEWQSQHEHPKSLEVIQQLASAGNALIETLTRQLSYGALGDLESSRKFLLSHLRSASVICLDHTCTIPWEMIFLGENLEAPEIDKFIGSRTIVVRNTFLAIHSENENWDISGSGNKLLAKGLLSKIGRKQDETLALFEDNGLTSANRGNERKIFEQNGIRYDLMDPVDSPDDAVVEISKKTRVSYLSHFNCNGSRAELSQEPGKIVVSNSAAVDHTRLQAIDFQVGSTVVLNVCHACQLDERFKSVVGVFSSKHIGAVIGPMHVIEDYQSTSFAKHLYDGLFLEGLTVGSALLSARKKSVETDGNPAALLYTLFGDENSLLPSVVTQSVAC